MDGPFGQIGIQIGLFGQGNLRMMRLTPGFDIGLDCTRTINGFDHAIRVFHGGFDRVQTIEHLRRFCTQRPGRGFGAKAGNIGC